MHAFAISFGWNNKSGEVFAGLRTRLDKQWDLDMHLVVDVRTLLGDKHAIRPGGTARVPAVRASIMNQAHAKYLVEMMCHDLSTHKILCVGCCAGNHRSPSLVMKAAEVLRSHGWVVEDIHLGLLWRERFWRDKQELEVWLDQLASRIIKTCAPVKEATSLKNCWSADFVMRSAKEAEEDRRLERARAEEAYMESFRVQGKFPPHPWRYVCHHHWKTGRCRHGEACHYRHLQNPLTEPSPLGNLMQR